ncbi:polysaccharide deacetylase family protein [Oryzifoliimicrobium ureilyticus]|uniref:polysaccharide deacetylase family protein n=1 Tax=Oryzifoliimicrobium ureilyticus TaxID=3113724 RepID=UPI0030761C1D
MRRLPLFSGFLLSLLLAGCQSVKHPEPDRSIKTGAIQGVSQANAPAPGGLNPARSHHLVGRTLVVSSIADIKLAEKELILSFDDGPIPGRTEKVLATLNEFGVKGAFMMVGEMAALHPDLAKEVARDGNTIGSHTFKHANLAALNFDAALAEVVRGQAAVTKATGADVNFFRFPYLADSRKLRAAVTMRDMIVMDVDIDSKDYYRVSPSAVMKRTMDVVRKKGRGIVLMHDIHLRTAGFLPTFLTKLESEGYKVVTLKFKKRPTSEIAAS